MNIRAQRETPLEAKNRKDSSNAYDSQLLSKIGRPKTPTQTAAMGSLEGSPTSRRPSMQKPKSLSLADRSQSISTEPMFTPSLGSSKWASSPRSQSGLISPGLASSVAGAHRSPTFEATAATSPGAMTGAVDETERFARRNIAQPRFKRSDSSLSMAMSAMSTGSGAAGSVSGSGSGSGGEYGSGSVSRANRRVESSEFFSEGPREDDTGEYHILGGIEETGGGIQELTILDDQQQSQTSSLHPIHHHQRQAQIHQQQNQPHQPQTPLTPSSTSTASSLASSHSAAYPQAQQQQHRVLTHHPPPHHHISTAQPQQQHHQPPFAPHAQQHPTLIAAQHPPAIHAQQNIHHATQAHLRHRASHSRSGMPPKRSAEDDVAAQDNRGADTKRRTQNTQRASPSHPTTQSHPTQASYSSTSSAGLPNGSYASSAGLSVGGSSLTSISSHDRLSPSNITPTTEQSDGRTSPYLSNLSLEPTLRNSNPQAQSQPQAQPPLPPPPAPIQAQAQAPVSALSTSDAQATAAAAHSMASDNSAQQQPPPSAPQQLQANLFICDCCPKKPKKFDTQDELQ